MQIASIGPVTSKTIREHGLKVDIESRRHDIPGLVETVENFYQGDRPMGSSIEIASEFATAMQQLSAEAEKKSLPENDVPSKHIAKLSEQMAEAIEEFRTLGSRVERLEFMLERRLQEISGSMPTSEIFNFAKQLKKMDEQIGAIRNTESVNQRLFDSLHHELISYRDNFLHETLQKPFIRDLVVSVR